MELKLTIKGNEYSIKFPNTGQYVQIQERKTLLVSNYKELAGNDLYSQYSSLLVDMEAYFTILCPQLIKDLNKPIMQLEMNETSELVHIYSNIFVPWFNECMEFVFGVSNSKINDKEKD